MCLYTKFFFEFSVKITSDKSYIINNRQALVVNIKYFLHF